MPRLSLLLRLTALAALAGDGRAQGSPEEQYRYLVGLLDKDMHELAIEEARAFLRDHARHEKSALVRYRLADALWELGRHEEAAREYEVLARLERFEYRAECLFRGGEAARARGDAARARTALTAVLDCGQGYLVPPALLVLAELEFQARRFGEAEARYRALLEEHAASAEASHARLGLVWCALERGDAAESARRARAFLHEERAPEQRDELRLLLGEALLAQDPAGALEVFRALETPERAQAGLRGEAFALSARGDHAAAARAFVTLLERAPSGPLAPEARLQAGVELVRAEKAEAALPHLEAAAEASGAEGAYWLAQAQQRTGRSEEALASLARALGAQPDAELTGRIHALRGDCLAALGRAADARRAYEQSGSTRALEAGAVAALGAGDSRAALALAERALAADPEGARACELHTVLAEAHFATKDYPAAEQAFAAALARAAPDAEARLALRLAWCRYLAGDLAAARARLSEFMKRHGATSEAEEALALELEIAEVQGDGAGVRALARRSLERYPQGRFADQAFLAEARSLTGAEARSALASWLERFPASALGAEVRLELAELESAAGAHADAERRMLEVLEQAPDTGAAARARYGLAWSAWERRDLAAARQHIEALTRAQEVDPTLLASAFELLVWVHREAGDLPAAMEAWRALRAAGLDDVRRLESARACLTALRAAGRFDEARALLEECAQSLTRELTGELWLESAYLALDQGDHARAEMALEKARRLGADAGRLAEACFHAGEAQLAAGESARARTLLARAAESPGPRAADALYRLGFAQLEGGELPEAARSFERLVELEPSGPRASEARFLLGECAFRRGAFEEAARLCLALRSEAEGELRAKALFRAGLALGELGHWRECASVLGELAQAFPSFPNLAEGELWRGRALLRERQGRAARAAFERTLALDSGMLAAQARLGLGALAEAEGKSEEALSEYLKVALLYAHEPSVAQALFAAARVLEAQGQTALARARYEELVREHAHSPLAAEARERLQVLATAPVQPQGKERP
jgi:TolA-binding protein